MLRQREGNRSRLVVAVFHLVDVPAAVEVAHVHDPHVGPYPLDLLVVPQREGVVVAVVHDDRIGQAGHQVVVTDVAGHVAVAAVVVVPVLCGQDDRHAAADERGGHGHGPVVAAGEAGEPFAHAQYAQSDPDAEGIEGAGIDIVAFTRLGGARVEVEHEGDTHHEEDPHDHREVLRVAVELVDQADDTQDEGQEVVGVASRVVAHLGGQVVLRAEVEGVDRLDAGEPLPVGHLAEGLVVALAADKVPQKVTPVHEVELVAEEVAPVLAGGGGRVAFAVVVDRLALARAAPFQVAGNVVVLRGPHAREEGEELGGIFVVRHRGAGVVAAVFVAEVIFVLVDHLLDGGQRRGVLGAEEQRLVAVLVAVEQVEQPVGIVRIVAVHGRVGGRTDHYRGVTAVADHDDRQTQKDGVEDHLALAVRDIDGRAEGGEEQQDEEEQAAVHRQPQSVDEPAVHDGAHGHRVGDDEVVDEEQDCGGQQGDLHDAPGGDVPVFAEVVDEDQRGDREQVEQVDADREAHQVGDQHQPAVGVRLVGHLLPFEHGPQHHGREERREGIDLALDGREPEGVGERVGEGAHQTGSHDGPRAGYGQLLPLPGDEPPAEVGDAPEEEQDGEGAGQCRHGVGHHGDRSGVRREHGEQPGEHHEEGGSGGMAHFELIGGGNELGAVPQAGRRFDGHQVDDCGDGKREPAD